MIACLGVAALAWKLHAVAGFGFPQPWPDESHFLAPALQLSRHATLSAPQLNAPQGIFWLPHGYYVLLAPFLALGGDALATGRLLSLLGIGVFAYAVASVAVRAGAPRWLALAATAAWLCSPRVVMAANIVRMEGPLLGLAGAALLLAARGRLTAAVGVALLTPLLHPIGVVVVTVMVGAPLLRLAVESKPGGAAPLSALSAGWRDAAGWERSLLAAAAVAAVTQAGYLLAASDLAVAHLSFQLDRKAAYQPRPGVWHLLYIALALAAGVALSRRGGGRFSGPAGGTAQEPGRRAPAGRPPPAGGGHASTSPGPRPAAPGETFSARAAFLALPALAAGFVVVDVVGQELWYQVLGRETAALLVAVSVLPSLRRRTAALVLAGALLMAAAGWQLSQTLTRPQFGMVVSRGDPAEWRSFVAEAIAELQRLDASSDEPAMVIVDPLSGFGSQLFARDWRRLTFVQPTPVTPLPPAAGDYLLLTPGAPFATPGIEQDWNARRPLIRLSTAEGTFALQVLDHR